MPSRVAIVTGGTRGLGRALSLELTGRDYTVTALYGSDEQAAAALRSEWSAQGRPGMCVKVDLREAGPIALPLDLADAEEVVFVHNAVAPFEPRPLHLLQPEDFAAQWAVAVHGFMRCLPAMLRAMTRVGRGTIVAVGSRSQVAPPPRGFSAYASAKNALSSLTASVAAEYGARGIRAFTVRPDFMRTSLTDAWDSTLRDAVARSGESSPESVAKNVVDLITSSEVRGAGESYDV